MLDKLNDIDISAVKKLVKIKKEQDQLRDYLNKAEDMKGKTNDAVFSKVISDYRSRHENLEATAEPLKEEAHREYVKLSSVLDEISEAHERAALDQEELEFRHALGELSDKELEEKIKEATSLVERRRSELAAADQLKKKFVEAFRSEQELDDFTKPEDKEEEKAEEKPEEKPDEKPEEEVDEDMTRIGPVEVPSIDPVEPVEPLKPIQEEPSPPPNIGKDETWIQPLNTPLPVPVAEADEEPEADRDQPASDGIDSTFIVPEATLTTEESGRPMTQFQLGALSYIGRANDNQVQIKAAGVSRKHAVVTAGPDGFVIRDLDSQNGTYVNQTRVTECTLANGDRVRIGHVQLVFNLAS